MENWLFLAVLACAFYVRALLKRVGVLERQVRHLHSKISEFPISEALAVAETAPDNSAQPAVFDEIEAVVLPIATSTAHADKTTEPVAVALNVDNAPSLEVDTSKGESIWKSADKKKDQSGQALDAKSTSPAKPKQSFEDALGTRWAIWVGGLAFALGGIFLVRYSIESGFFSPALRVFMAVLFGLGALGAGEFLRRRDIKLDFAGDKAAQVPAILTAAGAAILFAAVYVSYGVYDMIGSTTAFTLLASVSLGVIALGLLHGSVLAGLGLVGSFVTPALVSSQSPNVWTFFTYLGVVLAASGAFAKIRHVEWILASALAGMGFWTILESWHTVAGHPTATLFAVLLMATATALFWIDQQSGSETRFEKLFPKLQTMTVSTILALTVVTIAGLTVARLGDLQNDQTVRLTVLAITFILSAFAWWQVAIPIAGLWPSVLILFCAVLSAAIVGSSDEYRYLMLCVPLGLMIAVPGLDYALRSIDKPTTAIFWSLFGKFVPLAIFILAVLAFANLDVDLTYGMIGAGLAALSAYGGLLIAKQGEMAGNLLRPSSIYIAGAGAYALIAIPLLLAPSWTGIALAAIATALAYPRLRDSHPMVPWLVIAFAINTVARFALDPAVVGYEPLSTTPVLNWLLAGYGLPAAAFAYAAFSLSQLKDRMPCLIMQGIAVTVTLAGAVLLVRHGMNSGIVSSEGPLTLGEHSLYTILALGASLTLIRLDRNSPSPVFSFGSMIVSYIGIISALWHHFVLLNPLYTGEFVGSWPLLNLSAIAYLVPALLLGWIWRKAIGKRPAHYLVTLSAATFIFISGWLVISLRHATHGAIVAFEGLDAYGYSGDVSYFESLLYLPVFMVAAGLAWVARRNPLVEHLSILAPWFLGATLVLFGAIHLVLFNPYLRSLDTGASLLFNRIGLGLLLPSLLFGAWAWMVRRETGNVAKASLLITGIASGVAAFCWLNLTIRHFFQGQNISFYVPLSQPENYTFSVAWLLTGVAILAAGVKLNSRPLRILSAALVVLTVVKVFLFDMSSLQGVLRAFSFMGLGLSLMGIGLFYQRVLAKAPSGQQ